MTINDIKIWNDDLDEAIKELPELAELAGQSVLITGATGLICSAVVDVLIRFNTTHDEKISILTAGRSEEKVRARFAPYTSESWFKYIPYDAAGVNNSIPVNIDYIIHGASNASPNHIVAEPVETRTTLGSGTVNKI